jgi:hypothetical protein
MKKSKISANESGIAHLGLLLVVLVFLGVGALVYWRFSTANENESQTAENTSQTSQLNSESDVYKQLNGSMDEVDHSTNTVPDDGGLISNE